METDGSSAACLRRADPFAKKRNKRIPLLSLWRITMVADV